MAGRGNWLSDRSELSRELWLPHLIGGQGCQGCSPGESHSRIMVLAAWNGPLVHGVLDPSFRITLSCMLKKMQCLQQDTALYFCGLQMSDVGNLGLPSVLASRNHWGLRVLGCCSVVLMAVTLILMLSGWRLELQPVRPHSRQEEGEVDGGQEKGRDS